MTTRKAWALTKLTTGAENGAKQIVQDKRQGFTGELVSSYCLRHAEESRAMLSTLRPEQQVDPLYSPEVVLLPVLPSLRSTASLRVRALV
jgi:hypothetical protein